MVVQSPDTAGGRPNFLSNGGKTGEILSWIIDPDSKKTPKAENRPKSSGHQTGNSDLPSKE